MCPFFFFYYKSSTHRHPAVHTRCPRADSSLLRYRYTSSVITNYECAFLVIIAYSTRHPYTCTESRTRNCPVAYSTMSPGMIGNDVRTTAKAFRGMEGIPPGSSGSSGAVLAAVDMGAVRGPAANGSADWDCGLNLQLQAVGKIHSQKARVRSKSVPVCMIIVSALGCKS